MIKLLKGSLLGVAMMLLLPSVSNAWYPYYAPYAYAPYVYAPYVYAPYPYVYYRPYVRYYRPYPYVYRYRPYGFYWGW